MKKVLILLSIIFINQIKIRAQKVVMGQEADYAVSFKNGTTKMGGVEANKKYFLLKETETEYYYLLSGVAFLFPSQPFQHFNMSQQSLPKSGFHMVRNFKLLGDGFYNGSKFWKMHMAHAGK
jgi:hypothetical protein